MNEFNFKSYGNSNQTISYCEVDKCKAVVELKQQLDQLKAENDNLKSLIWWIHVGAEGADKATTEYYENRNTPYEENYWKRIRVLRLPTYKSKYKLALAEIKEITEPYQKEIDKICGNCRRYDSCHACCIDDLKLYEYRTGTTKACERFVELERFNINIVANLILQKISEVEECSVKTRKYDEEIIKIVDDTQLTERNNNK